ncbi:MAG: hypothetical protein EHM77_08495 [Planctomycetaceae bacterium]|nr:MAG: hypothetical protein EHM77_08495 [Planctomycetaceae bacterium]
MFVSKSALAWGKRLDRFDRADVTVAQFCRQEGVSQASFYQWRRKLRAQSAASQRNQDPPLPRFLPVSLATTSTAPTPPPSTPRSRMTIDLPGGIRIRFEIPSGHQHADQSEVRP